MKTEPCGHVSGPLPTPNSQDYEGLVHAVIFAPDPAAKGVVSVEQSGLVIRSFNTPAPTGALDRVLCLKTPDGGNLLNPTVYSVVPANAGDGLFVTYLVA